MQIFPIGHCLFSVHGSAGALTQAIFAEGLGTKPEPHAQDARWFDTVQYAFGPQGEFSHGFMQVLLLHDSVAPQSSSA